MIVLSVSGTRDLENESKHGPGDPNRGAAQEA